jgi:hypothetical protein
MKRSLLHAARGGLGALSAHRPIGTTDVDRDGRLVIERVPVPRSNAALAGVAPARKPNNR